MLSWQNWKCNVDWKWYDRKLTGPIWCTMWIRTVYSGWYHYLIWGAFWIGTYSVTILSWRHMKCYVVWKEFDREMTRSIWTTMWSKTVDKRWHHDQILGDICIGTDVIWCCLDQIKCYVDWKGCDRKFSQRIWSSLCIRTDDTRWCLDLIWGALWLEPL
jgi:hypothetical protein